MKNKLGFTLSEVLITLVIIAVVIAITVPSLNNTTKNEQYRAAAYKNLSVLNNAIRRCYAFDHKTINEFVDANDLKSTFFQKHLNIIHPEKKEDNKWPEDITVEETIYLNDGARYGISDKITEDCPYNIHNKEENIPCYFVYVDTNGEKKPNKLTMTKDLFQDINTMYAYADRFILQPGEIEYSDDEGNIPDPPNTPETPNTPNAPDTPDAPDTPQTPEIPKIPDNPETPDEPEEPEKPKMERCLDKRPYDECVKFCEKNGYHSALCK